MASGLKQIRARIQQKEIDLIIEVRDARIPNSSATNNVIKIVQENQLEFITIYNKRDLAESWKFEDENSILFSKNDRKDFKNLMNLIQERLAPRSSRQSRVMVVGIPNVGKSSIINGLRTEGGMSSGGGKRAVKVGNLPGVTKALSGLVSISPSIYVIDTPGILSPKITNVQEGLKVALCGGFYDKTVGTRLLADYLLYNLTCRPDSEAFKTFNKFYTFKCEKDYQDSNSFLPLAAKRIGALLPGGGVDLERAATFFVKQFRSGQFGRLSLE